MTVLRADLDIAMSLYEHENRLDYLELEIEDLKDLLESLRNAATRTNFLIANLSNQILSNFPTAVPVGPSAGSPAS